MLAAFEKLASGKWVLAALLFMLVGSTMLFNAGPYAELASQYLEGPMPEERFNSSVDLDGFLADLGDDGRALYTTHLILDFLNPLFMGSFFTLLIIWLGIKSRLKLYTAALLFPVLLVLAECIENGVLIAAVSGFPQPASGLSLLASATALKFISLGLCALATLLLAVTAMLRKLLSR